MKKSTVWFIVVTVVALFLTACGAQATPAAVVPPPTAPAGGPTAAVGEPTKSAAPAGNVNDVGRKLPDDAAPNEQQVYVLPTKQSDAKFAEISANVYNRGGLSDLFAIPLTRINKDFETIPGSAKSWKVSADGKTWTFALREDLNWSDGTPLTADDF